MGHRLRAQDEGIADHTVTLVPVEQGYTDSVACQEGCTNSFWTYGNQLYAFAETPGEPAVSGYYFALGCDPWGLEEDDFMMAWDVSGVVTSPRVLRWEPSP